MFRDESRLLTGIATCFGVRSPNDGLVWQPEMFQGFLDRGMGLPLQVNHGSLVSGRGVIKYVGACRRFAVVEYPTSGLLVLAEVDDIPELGDLFADLQAMTSQRWLPPSWGLSIGCHVSEDMAYPYEVSATSRPAHEDARIISVGKQARHDFELLTERRTAAGRM